MKLEDSVKRKRLGPTSKDRALRNKQLNEQHWKKKPTRLNYRTAVDNKTIRRAPFK